MLNPLQPFQIQVPLRGYDDLFEQLEAAVPPGLFYDLSMGRPLVAWTNRATIFNLLTDNPGIPIKVTAERLGEYHPGIDQGNLRQEAYFLPNQQATSFSITLGLGLNRLTATEDVSNGRVTVFEVNASPNVLFLESFGREVSKSTDQVAEQTQALQSPFSTRMLDQVITFQDLLPDVQSLKILSTKMLVRSRVHFPSTTIGTQDFIQTFALNTPVFSQMRGGPQFEIERSIVRRMQENLAGLEAHVWFPNLSVTQWLAFIKMADSLKKNYVIQNVRDDLVEVKYKGQDQLHRFNFNAPGSNFLTNLSLTNCFNNIEMSISMLVISKIPICMWAYPFDYFVTADRPIGSERGTFDLGQPLDLGLTFDSDSVDPFNDGWVGYSLTGRFEQDVSDTSLAQLGLDSAINPALSYPGSTCVYTHGPYTQFFNSSRADIQVNAQVTMAATLDNYAPGPVDHLAMELPIPLGILQAGTPYLSAVKFADTEDMSVPGATGNITVQESSGGASSVETVVTDGYVQFSLVPTRAGQIFWTLTSGPRGGQSLTATVIAGPFADFDFLSIANQVVGVPFSFAIQAVDQYGNPVTDTGMNTKVSILTTGFVADSITPNFIELVDGVATVNLMFTQPGTGQLQFQIDAVITNSNTFSVT